MVDFSGDSPETLEFKGAVVVQALLLSILVVDHIPPGPVTATALRLLARVAEVSGDITPEALAQELDFLMADAARK